MSCPVQIVLAEFDIDKGSCIRTRYPPSELPCGVVSSPHNSSRSASLLGSSVDEQSWDPYLADQLLPDGAEKHASSKVVFALNRPTVHSKIRVPVFVFVPHTVETTARLSTLSSVAESDAATVTSPPKATQSSEVGDALLTEPSLSGLIPMDSTITAPPDGVPAAEPSPHTPAALSDSTTLWLRHGATTVPQAFFPEVLVVDPRSGAIRLRDARGDIVPLGTSGHQHVLNSAPDDIPQDVLYFARRHHRYRSGGDWNDPALAAAVGSSSDGPPQTPTLIPSPSTGPGAPAAASVASSSTAGGSGGSASTPHFKGVPYRFATLTSTSFAARYGLLFTEEDYQALLVEQQRHSVPAGTSAASLHGINPEQNFGPMEDSLVFTSTEPFVPEIELPYDEMQATSTLYGVAAAVTKKDPTARRGGVNKSVAIVGPCLEVLMPLFPLLVEAAELCCDVKGSDAQAVASSQEEILIKAFDACAEAVREAEGRGRPASRSDRLLLVNSGPAAIAQSKAGGTHVVRSLSPFAVKHVVSIPVAPYAPSDIAYARYGLTQLVEALREKVFVLLTALMTHKRIVVFSKVQSATAVCEACLALGTLGAVLEPDFVAKRVFPYTSINHMALFQNIPGFVVGTRNPMFETQTQWWDVLVDIDTGVLCMATAVAAALGDDKNSEAPHHAADAEAAKDLLRGIVHLRALMADPADIERFAMAFLMEYYRSCILFAQFSAHPGEAFKALPQRFVNLEAARNNGRLRSAILTDAHDLLEAAAASTDAPMQLYVAALRRSKDFEDFELMQLVQELLRIAPLGSEKLSKLLGCFPFALGGLAPLAAKVFHGSLVVRMTVVALLRRLVGVTGCDGAALGKLFLTRLNSFLLSSYEALAAQLPDTSAAY